LNPPQPDYILYLDETGDHTMGVSDDIGKRYLGIAAPFFERAAIDTLEEAILGLKKKHLPCNGTIPVLHRKEIMQCRGPFSCLQDEGRRKEFDAELVDLIANASYKLLAVTIDKAQHGAKTYRTLSHPYHYCLHAVLERFCGLLDHMNRTGHVVAEARGKTEDYQLRAAYRKVYECGTSYLTAETVQKTLVSAEIEIRKKHENVAGLQLADMLAHPANRDVLVAYERLTSHGSDFTLKLAEAMKAKYNRKAGDGRVKGYGKILLS
jgi:hypothetical protein